MSDEDQLKAVSITVQSTAHEYSSWARHSVLGDFEKRAAEDRLIPCSHLGQQIAAYKAGQAEPPTFLGWAIWAPDGAACKPCFEDVIKYGVNTGLCDRCGCVAHDRIEVLYEVHPVGILAWRNCPECFALEVPPQSDPGGVE